ncbi:MAG: SprB repeat-containing protein, partial [Flavobacteriales bacterium]|nr:SprB repeat-containing protein [Flavobacteriales bacterium]
MKNSYTLLLVIVFSFIFQITYAMPGGGGGGGTPCVIGGTPNDLGNVAAGDGCGGATSLGAMDAVCACDGATIVPMQVQGTTVGAIADQPYLSILDCQGGSNQDNPAADVWYTVDFTGNELTIDLTSTMNDINVALWVDDGGGCGNLVPRGCAFDGSGDLSGINFQNVYDGETVYIQISGADVNDVGTFDMTLTNDVSCVACIVDEEVTITPLPVNGTYLPGQTVNMCYAVLEYSQENTNWMHGLVPVFGSGWDAATFTAISVPENDWQWFTNIPTPSDGNVSGWFYDSNGNGDPTDNYGQNIEGTGTPLMEWCWSIDVQDVCNEGLDLSIDITNYSDGETGSWSDVACGTDYNFEFLAYMVCCEFPDMDSIPTCPGMTQGTATAIGMGTDPHDYAWSNGVTQNNISGGHTITNLAAGVYQVTVTDVDGCTRISQVEVTETTAMIVSAVPTNASCAVPCDGAVDLTVSAGAGGYTYLWSNGATSEDISNYCGGSLSVTVTDAANCVTITSATVTTPPLPTVTASTTQNETCDGDCDGAVSSSVSGGTGTIIYNWSSGGNTNSETSLCDGTYTITVSDDNGCTDVASTTVTPGPIITAVATADGPYCLELDASGTTNSFSFDGTGSSINIGSITSYSWNFDDGNTGSGSTTSYTYTTTGTFDVTLTVSDGTCTDETVVQVIVYPMPTVTLVPTDVSCNGLADGEVVATGGSGTPSYTYTWGGLTPVAPNSGGSDTETGLAPGIYTVTVSDNNGCMVSATATIIEQPALSITMAGNDASCNGASDGDASATVSGGTPGYTYSWNDASFSTTSGIAGLTANTYTIIATDAAGCTITDSQVINEPPAMTLTPSSTTSSCGNSDGSASVVATGGAGGYTYSWNDPNTQTSATASNLYAGSFTVIVTDANSCTITTNVNVTDAGSPTVSIINAADATCNGYSDGTAEASATGGTPGYIYTWSNGETTAIAAALPAGTHSVTITDSTAPDACIATASVTITDSPLLNTSILSSTNPLCPGTTDGTATTSVSGGTTGYTYLWSNGETVNPAIALGAGNTSVVVTDAQGCTVTDNITLTDPPAITVTVVATDALCNGASDGSADGTISGGTGAYTFAWSNGATTEDISGVPVGAYTLNVTDANGCIASSADNVAQPTLVAVSLACTNVTNPGGSDGTSIATGSGGTAGYTYTWDVSGTTGTTVTGLMAGTVNVTATDANGCVATISCVITVPNCSVTGTVAVSPTLCLGSVDGITTATMNTGGTAPYTYSWDAAAGNQTTQTATGLALGSYNAIISDVNGCAVTVTAIITSPAAMVITATPVGAQCLGGSSGSANSGVVSGGTPAYTYAWSNATALQTATGLVAGTYTVTITDVNNCTGSASITITEPTAVNPSIVGNNVSCFGANDGDATISVSGGTTPYSYQWDDDA